MTPATEAMTFRVASSIAQRLRNAVYWTPGATATAIVEDGLIMKLDAMEKANGGPFQQRGGPIKTGRR
jgi:hypothetical protein